jgi:hypothetical protein
MTLKINRVPDSLKDSMCTKFGQNPLKDVDSKVFTRMLRTDGSVTISLRNFVGEGIIRKIYIPIFDCIASIIDECYSRNSPKLLNHLNVYFYQHSSDNPFPNSLSHARKYFQTEDVKMAICELLNMFNVITSNAHNIETEKSGNNFKDFKLPCSICYVDTRCMTTVRI